MFDSLHEHIRPVGAISAVTAALSGVPPQFWQWIVGILTAASVGIGTWTLSQIVELKTAVAQMNATDSAAHASLAGRTIVLDRRVERIEDRNVVQDATITANSAQLAVLRYQLETLRKSH